MTPPPLFRYHRYGPALLAIGGALGALAAAHSATLGPWGVGVLVWSAFAWALIGAAYLLPRVGPRVFGKRTDGTLPSVRVLLLLPYLLPTWAVWELRTRLPGCDRRYDQVAPGLFLGRRPRRAADLPPDVALVADLTSEFAAPRGIRAGPARYRCLPTLDADAPPEAAALRALTEEVAGTLASGKTVYVHCALGRGRSVLAAAAVLHALDGVEGAPDAAGLLSRVRSARPGVRLHPGQARLLERMCEECREAPCL